jgi:uncharacterized peroxidase-related enzyme
MARIQPNKNPGPKAKEQLDGVRKMLGGTPNVFTTLSHSPAALGVFTGAFAALGDSQLPASLREQIALTVAGANGCDYCASAHTALGKMQKVSEGELSLALAGKSADTKINAALSFARKLVLERGHVGDADVDALRRAGYTDGDIVDIVAVVGFNIFTNYINEVAGTDIDFPVVKSKGAAKAA